MSDTKESKVRAEVIAFPVGGNRPSRVAVTQNVSNTFRVRVTGPVGDIDDFAEEIDVLETAQEGDLVVMQISSPGGDFETCDFMVRRMAECEAAIVVEIGLLAASAASAMALQADEWIIYDSSTMMIHACSYSPGYGKEVDVHASVQYTHRVNREWVERTYRGFLTEEELVEVIENGKDLYFYADDLRKRLPAYAEYRQDQIQLLMEEMEQEAA